MMETDRTRKFVLNDKIYQTSLCGSQAVVTEGKIASPKIRDHQFSSRMEALDWLLAKERAKMRSGFVLVNHQPDVGQPSLMMALPKGYTGALPIASADTGQLLTTCVNPSSGAELLVIIEDGEAIIAAERPMGPVQSIKLRGLSIYLLSQHQVSLIDDRGDEVTLTDAPNIPAGVLEIVDDEALWYESGELRLVNLDDNSTVQSWPVQPALYGGHTTQLAAALSLDYVVYSDTPGKIVIFNRATLNKSVINADIQMIGQMVISGDRLYVSELYGNWGVYRFDLNTGNMDKNWQTDFGRNLNTVAVSPDGLHVAIESANQINVFNTSGSQLVRRISIDHAVKRSNIIWTNNNSIAARIDAGFVAVYRAVD